jgi:F-type H+-transporting ATPase subunit epsilon
MELELITAQGMNFKQKVYEVIIPTIDGTIGVMKGHMPLISITSEGVMAVRNEASDSDEMLEYYVVSRNGVVEINADKIRILADEAERAEDIDEKEAEKAYETAQKIVNEAKDKQSLDEAMMSLDRYAVRLKVADLRRHHRR